MKIGIIYLGSSEGGSGYSLEIASALSTECEIICYLSVNNPLLSEWEERGLTVKTFETYSGFKSLLFSLVFQDKMNKLANQLNADNVDLLLDTMPSPWRSIYQRKVKSLCIWATVIHDPQPHPDRWSILVKLSRRFLPIKSDVEVAISQYCFNKLKAISQAPHVVLMEHGVYKTDMIEPEKKIASIKNNNNKFIFFGRIEAYKGLDILISAFELAQQSANEIELSIVGRGPIEPALLDKIEMLNIRLVNEWLIDEQLFSEIDSHGCIVLPYRSATQSGPAFISISRGMPCIATKVGALPEQIIDGQNGILIKPNDPQSLADAMIKISQDSQLSAFMSSAALDMSQSDRYNWELITKQFIEDIREKFTTV